MQRLHEESVTLLQHMRDRRVEGDSTTSFLRRGSFCTSTRPRCRRGGGCHRHFRHSRRSLRGARPLSQGRSRHAANTSTGHAAPGRSTSSAPYQKGALYLPTRLYVVSSNPTSAPHPIPPCRPFPRCQHGHSPPPLFPSQTTIISVPDKKSGQQQPFLYICDCRRFLAQTDQVLHPCF